MAWSDERLDEAFARIDRNFERVFEEMRAMRSELRAEIGSLGADLGGRIDDVRRDQTANQRQFIAISWGLIAMLVVQVTIFAISHQ